MPMPLKKRKQGKKFVYSYKRGKKSKRWDAESDAARRSKTTVWRPEDLHVGDLPEGDLVSAKGKKKLRRDFRGRRPTIRCPKCKHTWQIRVTNPQRCPKCGARLYV